MDDAIKLFELLIEIKTQLGYWAFILMITLILSFFLFWHFAKTLFGKIAAKSINQGLEQFKSKLFEEVGLKLLDHNKSIVTEINSLNSKVDLLNKTQFDIDREERISLIDLNFKLRCWYDELTSIPNLTSIFTNNGCNLEFQKLEKLYNEFKLSFAKLELFISDEAKLIDIHSLQSKLFKEGNKEHAKFIFAVTKLNTLRDTNEITDPEYYQKVIEHANDYSKKQSELFESSRELYLKYTSTIRGLIHKETE